MSDTRAKMERFKIRVNDRVGQIVQKITWDIYAEVVPRTPVDTGFARGNWRVMCTTDGTEPPPGEIDNLNPDGVLDPGAANEISGFKVDPAAPMMLWVFNNCKYIIPLEHGHSKQNTEGILWPVVERIKSELSSG